MARPLKGCARVGEASRVRGTVWVHGHGEITVGDRVVFDASEAPIELHAKRGATIVIGDDCVLSGGSSIDATSSITLGARCRVGPFCKAMDNHFHALRGDRQVRPQATPVVVEDDVELGAESILLPGAHVGRGSRIGPRAVVRRRVGPGSVVAGPAVGSEMRPRRTPAPRIDVSVVIPTFRRPELVVQAIQSALEQQRVAVEVIVVDDSPEGSARQAVLSVGDPRVTYVHRETPSGGRPGIVRNDGWRRARGRYVHFLDDDDLAVPGAYGAYVEALDAHPLCAMGFGVVEPFGEEGAALERERAFWRLAAERARMASRLGRFGVVAMLFEATLFQNSSCMVRRSALEESGGFDIAFDMMEETELHIRGIRERGCVFLDRAVVRYRLGATSLMRSPGADARVTQAYVRGARKYRATRGAGEFIALKVLGKLEMALSAGARSS
jgi:acetyltransferase-like isoleucine patch superfamily enzyme/GT2 family glycosyltransferase